MKGQDQRAVGSLIYLDMQQPINIDVEIDNKVSKPLSPFEWTGLSLGLPCNGSNLLLCTTKTWIVYSRHAKQLFIYLLCRLYEYAYEPSTLSKRLMYAMFAALF